MDCNNSGIYQGFKYNGGIIMSRSSALVHFNDETVYLAVYDAFIELGWSTKYLDNKIVIDI